MKKILQLAGGIILYLLPFFTTAQNSEPFKIKDNYSKREVYITMRDGARLFTSIYTPTDSGQTYPILMERTPYSCGPYGENNYHGRLGPNTNLAKEKYISVYQDVRGRYKSEGNFLEMTPAIDSKKK